MPDLFIPRSQNLFAVLVAAPHFHRCESCGHTVIRIPASRHGGFSGIQVPGASFLLLPSTSSLRRFSSAAVDKSAAAGAVETDLVSCCPALTASRSVLHSCRHAVWGPFQHNLLRQRESRRRRRSSVTGGEQATGNVPPPALGEPHHHQE